ncbi:glutamine--fructose-6-phosphate transaminase (isomerizing) [Cellulomonas sp. ATA003]|uniref:glutamine--fructose-6-phosphate transaminase (isomerizing) n=1 Tax=Cellulomonas sp. ATA003 TaxID=3073064 RepID=UPI002873651B|nr:glutamine--fructose-6-phosphate transaminase (isomerizing) [Cellulomonas sp. ATA003]WNB86356.1 glutamine--fructose-6-phosphate transaminase (isomerizing) [Cellulomonas sp. ATA003]
MCGIVACRRGDRAQDFLLPALRRLEYRGYDSAGVTVTSPGRATPLTVRSVGRLCALTSRVMDDGLPDDCGTGIGHTRWATHGRVSEENAHPHVDCAGSVAVVHNGIIDNADELRARLERRGHAFRSQVDTEVVAHLVEEGLSRGVRLVDAVQAAVADLRGTWALAVTGAGTGTVVLACRRSPLVVGSSDDGHFAASDVAALVGTVAHVHAMEDGDVVELDDTMHWYDATGAEIPARAAVTVDWAAEDAEMGVFQDFMEKEISEQPAAAARLLNRVLPGVDGGALWSDLALPEVRAVEFVACGSSLYASAAAARVFRTVSGLPTSLVTASEHEASPPPGTLTVAVSQSGETADVLSAVDAVDGPVLAITNNPYSTLSRQADAVVDCSAGPEIGVAATKTFTAQVLTGSALALAHAAATRSAPVAEIRRHVAALRAMPDRLEHAHLTAFPIADALAGEIAAAAGWFFVSRGAGLPYAAEGALKLKEITYRWADAIAAGELKHGPIALIEEGTPVVVIESGAPARLASAAAEMSARGGRIIRIGSRPDSAFPVLATGDHPWGPLESVVALQHLARSLAIALGRDADKPRNLAKSVTVL